MERPRALVLDEDPTVRRTVVAGLSEHGFAVEEGDPQRGPVGRFDVVLANPRAREAREQIEALRHAEPGLLLVVLGEAPADGEAFDTLPTPLDSTRLRDVARRLRSVSALRAENRALQAELQRRACAAGIVGRSRASQRLVDAISRHARSDRPVWLAGEPGVGKEHAARVLHSMSGRSGLDFVSVPCAAVSERGGDASVAGLESSCGTLYLDGLPALPLDAQRILDRRAHDDPRGDSGRLVASDPSTPQRAAEIGRLLDGLRSRFEPATIPIAPLRERPEDIAVLARHFADRIAELNRLPALEIDGAALALLEAHPWPGNVAELRSTIEHAVLLATDSQITVEQLPEGIRGVPSAPGPRVGGGRSAVPPAPFRSAKRAVVRSFEASYLRDLLSYHAGNVTAAARQAGMLRSALQRLLRKHGLRSGEFRHAMRSGSLDARAAASPADDRG